MIENPVTCTALRRDAETLPARGLWLYALRSIFLMLAMLCVPPVESAARGFSAPSATLQAARPPAEVAPRPKESAVGFSVGHLRAQPAVQRELPKAHSTDVATPALAHPALRHGLPPLRLAVCRFPSSRGGIHPLPGWGSSVAYSEPPPTLRML